MVIDSDSLRDLLNHFLLINIFTPAWLTVVFLTKAFFCLKYSFKLKITRLISTRVFLQLSIVDPSICKWYLTVHYVASEDIFKFQYGRTRMSGLKIAFFCLKYSFKLKITRIISTRVFLQLSIVDPSIHKWCLTVHYVVPEDIFKFQYGRTRMSGL